MLEHFLQAALLSFLMATLISAIWHGALSVFFMGVAQGIMFAHFTHQSLWIHLTDAAIGAICWLVIWKIFCSIIDSAPDYNPDSGVIH